MNELYIFGKANWYEPFTDYKKNGRTLWALGTDEREGADLYFELHGIKINYHDKVIYELPNEVYSVGVPINNSISALLVYAYLLGFKKIVVVGSPMKSGDEYIEQRPALGFVVGWLCGKGLEVVWKDLPPNIDYGKGSQIPT